MDSDDNDVFDHIDQISQSEIDSLNQNQAYRQQQLAQMAALAHAHTGGGNTDQVVSQAAATDENANFEDDMISVGSQREAMPSKLGDEDDMENMLMNQMDDEDEDRRLNDLMDDADLGEEMDQQLGFVQGQRLNMNGLPRKKRRKKGEMAKTGLTG